MVLFLVDGEKGITHQDVTIGRIIHDAFRPVIVLINKWDVHPKGAEQARAERITKRELRNLFFAPVLFISAKTGQGLENILPLADELYKESCAQVPTSKVNQALQTAASKQPPPFKKGHQVKIFYGYQRPGHPPVFEVFVNHPESVTPSYLRYLEAEMRKEIGMEMTPMQIVFKEKADKREYVKKGFKRNFDPNIKEREKRYKKTHRKDTKK